MGKVGANGEIDLSHVFSPQTAEQFSLGADATGTVKSVDASKLIAGIYQPVGVSSALGTDGASLIVNFNGQIIGTQNFVNGAPVQQGSSYNLDILKRVDGIDPKILTIAEATVSDHPGIFFMLKSDATNGLSLRYTQDGADGMKFLYSIGSNQEGGANTKVEGVWDEASKTFKQMTYVTSKYGNVTDYYAVVPLDKENPSAGNKVVHGYLNGFLREAYKISATGELVYRSDGQKFYETPGKIYNESVGKYTDEIYDVNTGELIGKAVFVDKTVKVVVDGVEVEKVVPVLYTGKNLTGDGSFQDAYIIQLKNTSTNFLGMKSTTFSEQLGGVVNVYDSGGNLQGDIHLTYENGSIQQGEYRDLKPWYLALSNLSDNQSLGIKVGIVAASAVAAVGAVLLSPIILGAGALTALGSALTTIGTAGLIFAGLSVGAGIAFGAYNGDAGLAFGIAGTFGMVGVNVWLGASGVGKIVSGIAAGTGFLGFFARNAAGEKIGFSARGLLGSMASITGIGVGASIVGDVVENIGIATNNSTMQMVGLGIKSLGLLSAGGFMFSPAGLVYLAYSAVVKPLISAIFKPANNAFSQTVSSFAMEASFGLFGQAKNESFVKAATEKLSGALSGVKGAWSATVNFLKSGNFMSRFANAIVSGVKAVPGLLADAALFTVKPMVDFFEKGGSTFELLGAVLQTAGRTSFLGGIASLGYGISQSGFFGADTTGFKSLGGLLIAAGFVFAAAGHASFAFEKNIVQGYAQSERYFGTFRGFTQFMLNSFSTGLINSMVMQLRFGVGLNVISKFMTSTINNLILNSGLLSENGQSEDQIRASIAEGKAPWKDDKELSFGEKLYKSILVNMWGLGDGDPFEKAYQNTFGDFAGTGLPTFIVFSTALPFMSRAYEDIPLFGQIFKLSNKITSTPGDISKGALGETGAYAFGWLDEGVLEPTIELFFSDIV